MAHRVLSFFVQDMREGGAERSIARLANGTVARGIVVDLVLIQRKGSFLRELDPRINIIELSQTRTLTAIYGLKSYMERRRPAAVISSLTHTNAAAIVARMLSRHRTRLVVVEHNSFSRNRELKAGMVKLAYRLTPWLYKKADLVAAVSAGVRLDIALHANLQSDRIAILYNPVVTDELFSQACAPIDHPWLCLPGPPVVLSVGRFSPQKNFGLLVDAFARLRLGRSARLIILGDGTQRSELEARVSSLGIGEDVDLPGFEPNPFRFMARASVYVLSSKWEGLPTALIEAMACGTPVVTTDYAGGDPREILVERRLGRIVPPDDPDALAAAITATLDAPGDRDARVERAKEFGVECAVDRYLKAAQWDANAKAF